MCESVKRSSILEYVHGLRPRCTPLKHARNIPYAAFYNQVLPFTQSIWKSFFIQPQLWWRLFSTRFFLLTSICFFRHRCGFLRHMFLFFSRNIVLSGEYGTPDKTIFFSTSIWCFFLEPFFSRTSFFFLVPLFFSRTTFFFLSRFTLFSSRNIVLSGVPESPSKYNVYISSKRHQNNLFKMTLQNDIFERDVYKMYLYNVYISYFSINILYCYANCSCIFYADFLWNYCKDCNSL